MNDNPRRFLLTCILLLAALGQAQNSSPPPLTAEEILDRNIEALGGRAALDNVKSVVHKGVRERKEVSLWIGGQPATTGPGKGQDSLEEYWKAGKTLLILNAGTSSEMRTGTADGVLWMLFQGKVTITKIPSPSTPFATYFDLVNWRQRYVSAKLKGIKEVDGRPAYKVELTSRDGAMKEHYYDTGTFLLLRSESLAQLQSGLGTEAVPSDEFYSDYREVGGVKFPFQTRQKTFGKLTRFSEVQVNVDLDDAMFQVPTASKK